MREGLARALALPLPLRWGGLERTAVGARLCLVPLKCYRRVPVWQCEWRLAVARGRGVGCALRCALVSAECRGDSSDSSVTCHVSRVSSQAQGAAQGQVKFKLCAESGTANTAERYRVLAT